MNKVFILLILGINLWGYDEPWTYIFESHRDPAFGNTYLWYNAKLGYPSYISADMHLNTYGVDVFSSVGLGASRFGLGFGAAAGPDGPSNGFGGGILGGAIRGCIMDRYIKINSDGFDHENHVLAGGEVAICFIIGIELGYYKSIDGKQNGDVVLATIGLGF